MLHKNKIYNVETNNSDWIDLHHQQNFNDSISKVHIVDHSNSKVGKNLLINRLGVINDLIEYDWLNISKNVFKMKCKIC